MTPSFKDDFFFAPAGFRDFPPDTYRELQFILQKMKEVPEKYGYEAFEGPTVERRLLYEVKSGGELVGEVFPVESRSKEKLVLRPELTPTLGRLLVRLNQTLVKPVRWYSIPRCYRDETQQRGRVKEFWQLNVDMIGLDKPQADAEVIAVLIDLLLELGLKKGEFQVILNDRNVLKHLFEHFGVKDLTRAYKIFDKKDKLLHEMIYTKLKTKFTEKEAMEISLKFRKIKKYENELRETYKENTFLQELLDNYQEIRAETVIRELQELTEAEEQAKKLYAISELHGNPTIVLEELSRVLEENQINLDVLTWLQETIMTLKDMGFEDYLSLDLSLARGLDYYTGIIFEAFDTESAIPRAIAGGGRYDNLVSAFNGPKLPATGFGMGDTVIYELLKEKNRLRVQGDIATCLIAPLKDKTRQTFTTAFNIAHTLRAQNMKTIVSHTTNLKKSLDYANKKNIPYVIIIGSKDLENNNITIRNLNTKEQHVIPVTEVTKFFKEK